MAFSVTQKIKTIVQLIFEPKILSALISQRKFGYLFDLGWFESFSSKKSIDKNGDPIPWFSYPFIDFINNRLDNDIVLFEFGSGNSTKYFSKKVKMIYSVEHNVDWYNFITQTKQINSIIFLTKSDSEEEYLNPLQTLEKKNNIIIVDGLHRNACLKASINKLTTDGVIILDDSERLEYRDGIDYVENLGFKRLDFWGIAPTVLFKKCTTLFYKTNNCLKV